MCARCVLEKATVSLPWGPSHSFLTSPWGLASSEMKQHFCLLCKPFWWRSCERFSSLAGLLLTQTCLYLHAFISARKLPPGHTYTPRASARESLSAPSLHGLIKPPDSFQSAFSYPCFSSIIVLQPSCTSSSTESRALLGQKLCMVK